MLMFFFDNVDLMNSDEMPAIDSFLNAISNDTNIPDNMNGNVQDPLHIEKVMNMIESSM